MDKYLKLSFDNVKGCNCEQCILSFSKGEQKSCAGLVNRPICLKEGCRKDCPLIGNVCELSVIDANNCRYNNVMIYNNYVYADYTRSDYLDMFKTKSKEEVRQIEKEIDNMIENMRVLHERLLLKRNACKDVLKQMK